MNIGKKVRLHRLFSHPSGRLCSVAIDHFINYGSDKIPPGLSHITGTLDQIVLGEPDAITMHRGVAASAWHLFAGKVPWILQSTIARPDDSCCEQIAGPEDAVRMGADAFAVSAFVRGPTEGRYLKTISNCVRASVPFEMPVVVHIYPRRFGKEVSISFTPEDVAWAVRCAMECGADVIKTPYCNDIKAFAQVVSDSTVPVVAAGGPKRDTFRDSLDMLQSVVKSGAQGATVGRNVWGHPNITEAIRAIKAVVHDGKTPRDAMELAGLR